MPAHMPAHTCLNVPRVGGRPVARSVEDVAAGFDVSLDVADRREAARRRHVADGDAA